MPMEDCSSSSSCVTSVAPSSPSPSSCSSCSSTVPSSSSRGNAPSESFATAAAEGGNKNGNGNENGSLGHGGNITNKAKSDKKPNSFGRPPGQPPQFEPPDVCGYLMSKSPVYAKFLGDHGFRAASDEKTNNGKSAGGGSGQHHRRGNARNSKQALVNSPNRRREGRMSEKQEDTALLATASSSDDTRIRVTRQPRNMVNVDGHEMHPYQIEGLNFLLNLNREGVNGVLADEMGLGKTVQTISLWASLRERGVGGQWIVIAPKSVVGNWVREMKSWCGCIRSVRLPGTREERREAVEFMKGKAAGKGGEVVYDWDVCVTSYEAVLKESSFLRKIPWSYVVIDEAHRIKNENSMLSRMVRCLDAEHRLLITGTPLQNNLHELWSLLNFLLPTVFSDSDLFDSWFSLSSSAGESDKTDNVVKRLHAMLKPFMIRRVKKDVATELPPKKETKLYIGLTEMQMEYYTKILRREVVELNGIGGPDKGRLQNLVMQLRKVCNHPYLFSGAEPGPPYADGPHLWESSGKMQLLNKLLPKLKSAGSRVLIFSQMTRVLDILEDYLAYINVGYCRIDGATGGDEREDMMEEFNRDGSEKFCFLLSTRAGGWLFWFCFLFCLFCCFLFFCLLFFVCFSSKSNFLFLILF